MLIDDLIFNIVSKTHIEVLTKSQVNKSFRFIVVALIHNNRNVTFKTDLSPKHIKIILSFAETYIHTDNIDFFTKPAVIQDFENIKELI